MNLDPSVQKVMDYLITTARASIHPKAIILFGSRARGDARPKSDYDVAFDFDTKKYYHEWSAFCLEAQENAPTLLSMDLVNLNAVSSEFASKIHQEGIVLYKEK